MITTISPILVGLCHGCRVAPVKSCLVVATNGVDTSQPTTYSQQLLEQPAKTEFLLLQVEAMSPADLKIGS
jgi:hypothetical protein